MGNRIRHRDNRLKPHAPLLITPHDAPPIRALQIRVLHVVVARAVRFPDIDFAVLDRGAGDIAEGADHEEGLAGGVMRDGGALLKGGGVVHVEGAENGAFGGAGGLRVVDAVDE